MRDSKKTVKSLKVKAWKLCSEYIRRKHADRLGNCACFTCDAVMNWKDLQAGHGIGGRGNYVLFLEEVIKPQCRACNIFLGGNYEVFIPKLIDMYTKQQYEAWVVESRKPWKRTKADYLDLIEDLQNKLEEIGNG